MSATADDLSNILPTAEQVMEKVALAEAEKAAAEVRRRAKAEEEKKALIDRMSAPSGVSDEEALRRCAAIIQRAVNNGFLQVQVYRFPNTLCTDRGRAINNQEPGWEGTSDRAFRKRWYEFWKRHLRDRGYRFSLPEIVDFPGGVPGDVGITLKWG